MRNLASEPYGEAAKFDGSSKIPLDHSRWLSSSVLVPICGLVVVEGVACGDPLLSAEDFFVGDVLRVKYTAQARKIGSRPHGGSRLQVYFEQIDVGYRSLEVSCKKQLTLMSEFGIKVNARVLNAQAKTGEPVFVMFDNHIEIGIAHVILADEKQGPICNHFVNPL